MLSVIQNRLHRLYDLDVTQNVEDFLCSADLVRRAAASSLERGEALIVLDLPGDLSVGLYIDGGAVETLRTGAGWWSGLEAFQAFCLATEGVSHFVYLMFRASSATGVSQLELELQAEVDKYATALLDPGPGNPGLQRSRLLRRRLYDWVRFPDGPDTESGHRYRLANDAAARYAHRLESRYVSRGDVTGMQRDLRRFYRLGIQGKLAAASS